MNQSGHLGQEAAAIGVLSIANLCLLVTATFYRRVGSRGGIDSTLRTNLGYIAVGLGMCSQILYCLMLAAWRCGWVPFDPGVNSVTQLEGRLSNVGELLSTATVLVALFGIGLRRFAGVWVGGTTFGFWSLLGLGVALKSLFR
jgi:hypothetical protein